MKVHCWNPSTSYTLHCNICSTVIFVFSLHKVKDFNWLTAKHNAFLQSGLKSIDNRHAPQLANSHEWNWNVRYAFLKYSCTLRRIKSWTKIIVMSFQLFFFYKQTLNLPIILLKPSLEVYVAITNSSQGRKTGSWLKSI